MGRAVRGTRAGAGLSLAREVAHRLRRRAEAHVHAAGLVQVVWPRFVAAGAVAADRDALCEVAAHLSAWHSHPGQATEVPQGLDEALSRFSDAGLREFVKWLDELGESDAARAC